MGTAAQKKYLTGMSSRSASVRLKEIVAEKFPNWNFTRLNRKFTTDNGISLLALAEMWHKLRSQNKTVELVIQAFAESIARRNEKIHALDLVIRKQREALTRLQDAYNALKGDLHEKSKVLCPKCGEAMEPVGNLDGIPCFTCHCIAETAFLANSKQDVG